MPDAAAKAGVKVMGTGRSDFPNQINNVLAFPGIFRGALDVRASDINDEMKLAAAHAIAGLIPDEELTAEYIIPDAFDKRVAKAVAEAVAEAAKKTGVARI
jgi:malate dehydrogenase (oxaloacetate-decarboxylating)